MINDSQKPPKFSVITVCFNALSVIQETYESLRLQSSSNYEWIVIDGASSDGTKEWVAERRPDVFFSEPDGGIYDAMNKALRFVRGEYVFFLNAGDRFSDSQVLSDIEAELDSRLETVDVLYGDVVYFGSNGSRRKRFNWLTRSRLVYGDLCHQATFVRFDLFKKFGCFDLAYRYNADFDWLLRVFKGGSILCYINRDIVLFHDAGAHVMAGGKCRNERNIVRFRYCGRLRWFVGHWVLRIELKVRRLCGQDVG